MRLHCKAEGMICGKELSRFLKEKRHKSQQGINSKATAEKT